MRQTYLVAISEPNRNHPARTLAFLLILPLNFAILWRRKFWRRRRLQQLHSYGKCLPLWREYGSNDWH
jgi:hypothetical protein